MVLAVYYQNVRGINSKLSTVKKNSSSREFNIMCLTETWLNNSVLDSEIIDPSYRVYRRDRDPLTSQKTKGGGVLIAISDDLISFSNNLWCSDCEDLWVTVVLEGSRRVHIGCVYVPPGNRLALASFCDKLNYIVENNRDDLFVICGDFNLPGITWETDQLNSCCVPRYLGDPYSSLFVDSMSFSGMNQFNGFHNVSGNTLDLILNNNFKVGNLKLAEHPLVPEDPHHNSLEFEIDVSVSFKRYLGNARSRNFSLADYDSLNEALGAVDWSSELSEQDLNGNVERLYTIINSLFDRYVPSFPRYCKKYPTWYTLPTIKVLKEKQKFHKRWKIYKNLMDYSTYKLLRGRAKYLIAEDYARFIDSVESSIKQDPKYFWRYVRSKKNSPCIPDFIKTSTTIVTNQQNICNLFCQYFGSVFEPSLEKKIVEHLDTPLNIGSYRISRDKIKDKIISMPNGGAGPYEIPPTFLKKCLNNLIEPLHTLFNRSLTEGCFPQRWKFAHLVPVFKSGDKNVVENYRPISKLCVIGKLFESIVTDMFFFDVKSVLNVEQHGFIKKRSVDTNLFSYVEYVLGSMDSGLSVDSVYTDFSKAFDKINHSIMISKLAGVGVHGSLLRWFESYLTNRSQQVVLGQFRSRNIHVTSGVPQGSHLGPLLFIIYINDIIKCFRFCKILLYADDLKIFRSISHPSDRSLIQEDLNRFAFYCRENHLFLNFSKCCFITFSRKPLAAVPITYEISNHIISRVHSVRDLGIILDSKLLFDQHIYHITKKANRVLGFVLRTAYEFRNPNVLRTLYLAYVNSALSFGSVIWNPRYRIYIDKLESVQKRFIRHCQARFFPSVVDASELHQRLNLLTLEQRRQITDVTFVFKIVNNIIDCMDITRQMGLIVPSYNTRHTQTFFVEQASTYYYLNSPLNRSMRTYNSLSQVAGIDVFSDTHMRFRGVLVGYFRAMGVQYVLLAR